MRIGPEVSLRLASHGISGPVMGPEEVRPGFARINVDAEDLGFPYWDSSSERGLLPAHRWRTR